MWALTLFPLSVIAVSGVTFPLEALLGGLGLCPFPLRVAYVLSGGPLMGDLGLVLPSISLCFVDPLDLTPL